MSQSKEALEAKRAELAKLLRKGDAPRTFPASSAQRRLWILEQLEPGLALYNVPFAYHLRGELDLAALTRAVEELVRRHATLRTVFAEVDGGPVQLVHPTGGVVLSRVDLDAHPEATRMAEATRLTIEEARRPFDLARGPLLRVTLLRLGTDEHVLVVTMHHSVCDGWSLQVFWRELASLYEASRLGQPSALPRLPIQYGDYAAWEQGQLTGPAADEQLRYWQGRLAGAPALLELPTDRARPAVQRHRGALFRFELLAETGAGLREVARSQSATLFMTLLAAFQSLLGRYSRQDDVVVGAPVAGRDRAETEGLIGFFVNTLCLRTDLSGDPSFNELVARVREVALGAYAHQDLPFEKLVEKLAPERSLAHGPLFQVMFTLQSGPPPTPLPGLEQRPLIIDTGTAKFDLSLVLFEEGDRLHGEVEYDTDLFDASTIERMMRHYTTLLEGIVADPTRSIATLPLLDDGERKQQLVTWNDTRRDYPAACVHALIEAQATRTPDAVAVECAGRRYSYAELDRRANQLAHRLRALGVGAGALVGVYLERSIDMVAALLGIWKADAAYVPLDPAYPADRLAYMVEDSGLAVLVTEDALVDRLPSSKPRTLRVDGERAVLDALPATAPERAAAPEQLAYVIYTSGSTGRPKGVELTHRGVVNFLASMRAAPGLAPSDVLLSVTSLSFDIAGLELYLPLTVGAKVVIAPREVASDGGALRRLLEDSHATVMQATPSTWRMLLDAGLERADGLKLLCGGEGLPRELAAALLRTGGELWNLYGPTETTIWSTAHRVGADERVVSIGRPIDNTQVYVLDAARQLMPAGTAGELYIGGDGLARGYLGRPELTAERFVDTPYGRLYRTGDLARFLADGRLECLGRVDHQVKLRGFRIELGEIEAQLAAHPSVAQAVVVARELSPGDKQLVGYVVLREGELDVAALRAHLAAALPEYMVPAVFMALPALPLTPNGKVDRKALPAPERMTDRDAYVAPRSPTEEALAKIYAEVLGVARVGIEDDFFALGGHSLLATQVISRIRKQLEVELPLRALFEAPTIAALAEALPRAPDSSDVPIEIVRRDGPLELSFAQQRLWFLDQLEPNSPFYNVPIVQRLVGVLDVAALEASLDVIVARHEALRTTFVVEGGRPAQVIARPSTFALPIEEVGSADEARRIALHEGNLPFDLARGPLFRTRLLRVGPDEHWLLFTTHHIISDGWSYGVIDRELAACYDALRAGRTPELPPLPIQYADFAVWQRTLLAEEVFETQLAYWRERLRGAPAVLELPTDRPRPAVQSHRGAWRSFTVPASVSARIKQLSREHGATPFMTLLSVFQVLLSRYSRQEDVVVGTPVAGRNRAETEDLIGLFVNTLVVRTDLSGDPTFVELLQRVREAALGAYAHQDVPFEKLVEELAPERSLGHSPLFQVMFALQNLPAEVPLPGIERTTIELDPGAAKVDLSLVLEEREGGLVGVLEYATALFDGATIDRMIEHLVNLLEAVTVDPRARIGALPMITSRERDRVVVEWNQTARIYPQRAAHELFEAQVDRTPDAIAVVLDGATMSYRELDRRANQLAHRLVDGGAGRDVLIAICAERSFEMVIALLAIWKAGAAYLPLHPDYPAERLAYMVEDAHAPILLTQRRLLGTVRSSAAVSVILLDEDADGPASRLERSVAGQDLAYVMYTSGSTGRPKGVMVTHDGNRNHLQWLQEAYPLDASDRVAQTTPISFDASTCELFWPLLFGAAVVLARPGSTDAFALVSLIDEERVTTLNLVPSLLGALLDPLLPRYGATLRRVLCGGEAMPPELPQRFFGRLPGASLHNLYGPTEASVDATAWTCIAQAPTAIVPIGRPIANTQVYLLDTAGRPVPIGVPGELHIGGVAIARGYWGRPEATAERFVPNPFGAGVLYRSGDLARYRADGVIEYLGRCDDQVKLRGFRVELGEIEASLREQPSVQDVVVVVLKDPAGSDRLVAYVVPKKSPVDADALRLRLARSLPEHMIPTSFVELDGLPLTPNGKLDRRALPAPKWNDVGRYVAPRTATEELIAGIYADVLGADRVGVEDNFFHLGGHSLLATQVISRVRHALSVDLPLRTLFENKTVAALAAAADAARVEPTLSGRIELTPRGADLEPSFAQQRLWFLNQLEPGSAAYHVPLVTRLVGPIDLDALRAGLEYVVERHESLRTSFLSRDGRPFAVIAPPAAVELPVITVETAEAARHQALAETQRPFDVERGPLLRACIVRLGAAEHWLVVTMHHIVSDGWSIGVLTSELAAAYAALREGRAPALSSLPIQYADFAAWQRRWLTGEVLDGQLAYWRGQLAGAPALLELPTDRPRPSVRTHRGGWCEFVLPPTLTARLRALSRDRDATLFMTMLGAFQVLLHRYSGQEDIAVGSPVAGRNRAETEGLIGFFVNTLVLRTQLSGALSFVEILARVRETALGAYAHQDIPFEKLVAELAPERDLSRSPLFQVMFVLQNLPPSPELPGLREEPLSLDSGTAKFDLTLALLEDGDGIAGELEYDTDLFDAATVERMMRHYTKLLEGIVAEPTRPVAALPLLDERERKQQLVDWNATAASYPPEPIHQRFEAQVRATPDAVAVRFEGRAVSYRELDQRANQLAHHLRSLGVGTDVMVGVYVERSIEMVVALYAILKAGGAYVPLDPSYPRDRLAFMLEDARVPVLLTEERLRGLLAPHQAQVLCLDTEWAKVAAWPTTRPEVAIAPDQLAYVIFTSGSTGRPKGVMNTHAGIANRLYWMQDAYRLDGGDVVLQKTPFSFDVSVWEFFWPLMFGATLVVARPEGHKDPSYLADLISSERVTTAHFVPSMLAVFLQEPDLGKRCRSIRRVFCSGEALGFALQESFFSTLDAELHNLYGPTEAAVDVSFWACQRGGKRTIVPLGQPIANIQLHVLDARMEPVPIGVSGELYIGGVGLARGYASRPDLTTERFVPNPHGPGRLYKTGDLARYDAEGILEYLGRIDHQVKLRGFRIELGEIEARLTAHPAVAHTVVVARELSAGDKQLVAYVVLGDGELDVAALRAHLAAALPEYMVPALFMALPALPLTSSGKVDRKALPAPERTTDLEAYVAPRTPTEEALAKIYAEVLGVPRVSVEDDFFALGGHSLLATQVISRVRKQLEVELPLRALFEAPTVAALADALPRALGSSDLPIEVVGRDGPLALSFAQQRLWFLDRFEPSTALYNIPVAQRLLGPLDVAALERAVVALVERHESLRTTFVAADGAPHQVIGDGAHAGLSLSATGSTEEARVLVDEEARRPFDLATGPLFRALLLRLGNEEHWLVLTVHHVVSDGWSIGVMMRDLAELYAAFVSGRAPRLPSRPIQYADFAAWQRKWLEDGELDRQLGYWREELAGISTLELPTDRPRAAVMRHRGAVHALTIAPALTVKLRALAQAQTSTLFMTMLGALQVLLHRYSGQDDIAVGSPVAGRNRAETEGLIGFFVNTLVLRTQLSGESSFIELLVRVRETALGAYAHQDIPFENLVAALAPERDMSRSPLFQVMFALQNLPSSPELPGLREEPLPLDSGTAKFDLTLTLFEDGEGIGGEVEYDTDLFDASTIERMMRHYTTLLEGIVADPTRSIATLPLLDDGERKQQLVTWNDTRRDYSAVCVHALIEAQATRTPDAIAVECAGRRYSYAELDRRANQLAHHLRALGVGAGALVGVYLERSIDMVAALLGIWKADAAYVPLDPAYPADRLAYMVEDSGLAVLVTEDALVDRLPSSKPRTLRVDGERAVLDALPATAPERAAAPEQLAYVIYTSGSTGRPKGVELTHRGVVNFLASMRGAPGLAPSDVLLSVTSLSFDIAGLELYLPLTVGAKVVIAPREVASDGGALRRLLEDSHATVMQATPSTWRMLLDAGLERADGLKLLCGGEGLPRELAASLLRTGGELWNLYGPTETTIWSTAHRVGADERVVSIGRPIDNTQVYVLDAARQLMPAGAAGELYIGGDGLARGYLGRPELTAERFVDTPYGRLYRTGDLARFQSGGRLECLGRVDHQVKLRGFRIELGEIEAQLAAHPSVARAVVVARELSPGDKQLVGYVVLREGELDVAALRAHLAAALPEYMVPAVFMALPALPLTPNGKVDRKALPAPERMTDRDAYVAPRSPTEEALAKIYAEVLGVPRVGVEDDFFALGGHSLLATQVISRIRKQLEVELPLRALFEARTVAALAGSLQGAPDHTDVPIEVIRRDGPVALSFAQQRLWFLDRFEPGTALYNIPVAQRLLGPLDVAALERAVVALVQRHESLRTTFDAADSTPHQVIGEQAHRLSLLDAASTEEARVLVDEEARRPFDLATGPLFRALLLRLGNEEHWLVLTVHHVVSDGWSLGVMMRDLAELYAAFAAGRAPRLAELPIQYADFAAWQRKCLAGAELERQLGYWREELAGVSTLELPTDRPRAAVMRHRGAVHALTIAPALAVKVHALAQAQTSTLFMTMLGAFQVLLHRYSGQDDIAVGSPVAGRNRAETEGLIGFFVNTLVLRTQLSGESSFIELLARVRETALGAYAHQDIPFENLVAALAPERDMSRSPLFQVMFALQNLPSSPELPGLREEPLPLDSGTAKFDLTLTLFEDGEGIGGEVEYDTDLFDASTIERMMRHYTTLLEGIVADPTRSIGALPLLDAGERKQQLVTWNDTRRDYPAACVHALIEAQATRTPDAVAVECAGRRYSYAELDRRANQLAHRLRALGVGAGALVGVYLERSIDMVAALLGIWKADAAYVPLDPAYPADRLAYMVEDSGLAVLVTEDALVDRLPSSKPRTLRVDGERAVLDALPATAPERAAAPEQLAYVIYTSGSTGRPKGVELTHRGVVNFLASMRAAPGLAPSDVLLSVTSLSFDIAGLELYLPLTVGAKVVIAPREVASEGGALRRLLEDSHATVMQATPSTWRMLLDAGLERADGLKLLCGGEGLPRELAASLLRTGGELWNLYGPTETTIWSTAHRVGADERVVSIGRPIDNTQVYVLDAARQLMPAGAAGELYIGGDGLARGYLGRPELTAERFVDTPYGRLYRTGDLARFLADGRLECLGRVDHQVKLRGFRIELGEIEAQLAAHPSVAQAVVVARELRASDKALVAYLVLREGELDIPALRAHLAVGLPEYMVPAVFMALPALPLTPNGKVDRKALPVPERTTDPHAYVAPRTATEEAVAKMYAEVLGVARVGAEDDFFALGGHSLLAAQLVSRVRRQLGIELPLRTLFSSPVVALLATALSSAPGSAAAIARIPRDGELALSFAQQRLWFFDQYEPNSPLYNMPLAWRLAGPLDLVALERSLGDLVARHETLRTTFASRDGQAMQVVAPASAFKLVVTEVASPEEAERLAGEEARRPFDLSKGPLFRAGVLRRSAEEHCLLITLHHIVSDGWSMGVLTRDLATLYAAHQAGQPPKLAPLPIQYADFAAWQRQWLSGKVLDEQLGYWKGQLAGAPALLDLPIDHPRPRTQGHRGRLTSFQLSPDLTGRLVKLSRDESSTLFMTLLAGFQVLLSRYSGQEDVVVGTPVASRNRAETEGLIGFFINTLALRTDLSGNPSFRQLLRRVREVALGAYDHQDVPFEKLVEELAPERSQSYSPLFQVLIILQNFAGQTELPGVMVSDLGTDDGGVKFDLTLRMVEHDDRLLGSLEYNADLFEPETIEVMVAQLSHLLAQVTDAPDAEVMSLALDPPELQRETADRITRAQRWRAVPLAPQAASIPEQFALTVDAHADQIAVEATSGALSYRELHERVLALAHALPARTGDLVALLVEHDLPMVEAVLGSLQAGTAYVPLDPGHPRERNAQVLEDSGAVALIASPAQEALARALAAGRLPVVVIGKAERSPAGEPAAPGPETSAYLLYTSGSTGQPKGVRQIHRSVLHHARTYASALGLTVGDKVAMVASYCTDSLVQDLFGALLSGATLCLQGVRAEAPAQVRRWLAEQRVTVYHSTPTLFRHLFGEIGEDEAPLTGIRAFVLGGEEVRSSDLERFRAIAGPSAVFVNGFGLTESTVALQAYYTADSEVTRSKLPVGYPVRDTDVLLLNAAGVPASLLEGGEIVIRSPFVAQGYWNRPEQTAAAFRADPASGIRRYHTGDLGRRRGDGGIEHLGRIDQQVKIRGFRVETAEIESHLKRLPAVREAAVVPVGDGADRRLVAFLVCDRAALTTADLRAHLGRVLPDYMIPWAFAYRDALPLTPTGKIKRRALIEEAGKIDRRASSDPEWGEQDAHYVVPHNALEELVAGVFADVLGLDRVGAEGDFFELGGHSLLATRLVAGLREAAGVHVPLRAVFDVHTVAGLAELVASLRAHKPDGGDGPAAIVRAQNESEEGVLSTVQEKVLRQVRDRYLHGHMVVSLRLVGRLDVESLERALAEIAVRHDALRTCLVKVGQAVVTRILPPSFRLEHCDLRAEGVGIDEAARRAAEACDRPFDLYAEASYRAQLYRVADDEHLLVSTFNHLFFDGTSRSIFKRELGALYAAYAAGQPPPLPATAYRYSDYTAWQRGVASGERTTEYEAFLRERVFAGVKPLMVPFDRGLGKRPSALAWFSLAKDLDADVRLLARRTRCTPFMVMVAAYAIMLSRLGKTSELVALSVLDARPPGLHDVIGFFVNLLPLRISVVDPEDLERTARVVREAVVSTNEFRDVPYQAPAGAAFVGVLVNFVGTMEALPAEGRAAAMPGLVVDEYELAAFSSDHLQAFDPIYDLKLTLVQGETMDAVLQGRGGLFKPETVERMTGEFEASLRHLVANMKSR